MYKVILVIHVMTTIALIAIVLVQRSSSDGMGLSGSSSSNNFLSGRAAANFASRATALLALVFILTSLSLGVITTRNHVTNGSIADKIQTLPAKPASAPAAAVPVPGSVDPAASVPAAPSPEKPATVPSVPKPE